MAESIIDLVSGSGWTYALLFLLAAADAVLPVVPSEASVIAAAAGAWVGDNSSYLLGRRLGRPISRRFFARPKAQRRLEWARRQLDLRGSYIIVIARFIPGGRTATTFTAGLVEYPWATRFAPLTVLAALIWATYAALVGYLGGRVFLERPLYGLGLAFVLAAAVAVAVEASRRLRHG